MSVVRVTRKVEHVRDRVDNLRHRADVGQKAFDNKRVESVLAHQVGPRGHVRHLDERLLGGDERQLPGGRLGQQPPCRAAGRRQRLEVDVAVEDDARGIAHCARDRRSARRACFSRSKSSTASSSSMPCASIRV